MWFRDRSRESPDFSAGAGSPRFTDGVMSVDGATVLCPHGHVNRGDRRFCVVCGASIEIVDWPEDVDTPAANRRVLAVSGMAIAVLIVVGVVAFIVFAPSSGDNAEQRRSDGFAAGTPSAISTGPIFCPAPPTIRAESMELRAEGLAVDAAFLSPCPGEPLEADAELRITVTDGQRDIVLVSGIEPHLRWRTFTEALLEAATRSGSRLVVTLGSMSGMSPHTRPPAVTGSSTNRELADRLGLDRPSYQGPTGVVGVLHDTLDRAGIPVISLRVSVPYYLPDSPNPKATRALLRRFEQVSGIDTAHADLDGPAAEWQSRVELAVAGDAEVRAHVRRLESQVDQSEDLMARGDDLAAELEAFLREQDAPPDA